jgi:hypothetical protein
VEIREEKKLKRKNFEFLEHTVYLFIHTAFYPKEFKRLQGCIQKIKINKK